MRPTGPAFGRPDDKLCPRCPTSTLDRVGKVARGQRALSSAAAGDFAHPTTLPYGTFGTGDAGDAGHAGDAAGVSHPISRSKPCICRMRASWLSLWLGSLPA